MADEIISIQIIGHDGELKRSITTNTQDAVNVVKEDICENVFGVSWDQATEQDKQNSLIYAKSALHTLLRRKQNELK